MGVKHSKVSGKASTGDASLIQGPDWDADHVITGLVFASPAGDHAEGEFWLTTVGATPSMVFTIWQRKNGQDIAWFTSTR